MILPYLFDFKGGKGFLSIFQLQFSKRPVTGKNNKTRGKNNEWSISKERMNHKGTLPESCWDKHSSSQWRFRWFHVPFYYPKTETTQSANEGLLGNHWARKQVHRVHRVHRTSLRMGQQVHSKDGPIKASQCLRGDKGWIHSQLMGRNREKD